MREKLLPELAEAMVAAGHLGDGEEACRAALAAISIPTGPGHCVCI